MPVVYTIGLQRRPLSDLIATLRDAGIDAIIDVRLHNASQLAGYSKRADLAFLLQEGFGIAYEHRPELAPTEAIRRAYLQDGDWEAYEAAFLPLLPLRSVEAIGHEIVSHYRAPCLLCAEREPERCHRRLVAEYWSRHVPDLRIVHL